MFNHQNYLHFERMKEADSQFKIGLDAEEEGDWASAYQSYSDANANDPQPAYIGRCMKIAYLQENYNLVAKVSVLSKVF